MTTKNDFEKYAGLCEKLLEKCGGDYREAIATIHACADSFLALGQWEQAQKMDKLARIFCLYFNL